MQSSSKIREELEKSAWAWVNDIDNADEDPIAQKDLLKTYRLHYPIHKSPEWKCKKNCRSNPRCYCSLGEAKWLVEQDITDNDKNEDDEDMSLEKRVSGMPVGLKNLGNTCYVNSFLQIWFHNVPFREALYKWDPEQDLVERVNETLLEAEYQPRGKVGSLQALFAMMEFTNRRAVDPNDFIAKLGLDPQVQQDAAEFSKLFISLLESSLSNQKIIEVRSIVQHQFRGEYAYVTQCCHCQRESKRPSYFYELDLALQGQKTLTNCLEDFLKEEKLEGDNQYYCEGCESKQDATRCVRLSELPPVLNLQLNRFIFDMQTGRKKKLNSLMQFPEILDMSVYLREPVSDKNTYYLTGVLMHIGAEANHGHYIAHIQEATTGQWYKFSDAYVEKIPGKNPRLGSESDPLGLVQNGNKRASNGLLKINNKTPTKQQSSHNAYMLVYTSEASLKEIRHLSSSSSISITTNGVSKSDSTEPPGKKAKLLKSPSLSPNKPINDEGLALPMYLKAFIEQDRRILDEDIKEQQLLKETNHKKKVTLHSKMKNHYQLLPFTDMKILEESEEGQNNDTLPEDFENRFEFIPMEWLARYFSNPANVSPIDTSSTVCVHGKLDLKRIQDVKAVSVQVAEQFFQLAQNDSKTTTTTTTKRLNGKDAICEICVRGQLRSMKLERNMLSDHSIINDGLKQSVTNTSKEGEGYWVGKVTLKKWRTYAREHLKDKIDQEDMQFLANMNKFVPNNSEKQRDSIGDEVKAKLAKIGTDIIVSSDEVHEGISTSNNDDDNVHNGSSNGINSSTSTTTNGHTNHHIIPQTVNAPKSNADELNDLIQWPSSSPPQYPPGGEYFNFDIICPHGNLCIAESKRKLVTAEVWQKLSSYFTHPRMFTENESLCPSCIANDDKARLAIEAKKEVANQQKNLLSDILNERNRPTWARASLNRVYIIPRKFVFEWRQFVRNPASQEVIKLIPNEILLCSHGGLIYPLDLDTESDYESVDAWQEDKKRVYMVSEEEWSILKDNFTIDQEICVIRNREIPRGSFDSLLSFEPPVCDECVAQRFRQEEEELLVYRNVTVYVRRLTGAERPPEKDLSDPDYDCMNGHTSPAGGRKFRTNGHSSASNGHYHHSNNADFVRRSNRRQKVRGEREFTVSSDMLLRDFKVKIMEAFKVAPFDQNLCLNGLYLTDSSQTLGQLRVLPKSLIYLRADEPNPGASVMEPDDGWAMQHPEEGFKGTGLLEGS